MKKSRYDPSRPPRPKDVQIIARLGRGQPYIERIEITKRLTNGSAIATLYRFDRPMTTFEASAAQVKKIDADRKGTINITTRMIDRGRPHRDPGGRVLW